MKLNQSLQSAEMLVWAQTEPSLVRGAEGGEDGGGLLQPGRRGGTGGEASSPGTGGTERGQGTGGTGKNQEQDAGLRGLSTVSITAGTCRNVAPWGV